MSGLQGYDQWKTASPYDDEPDPIEEAERFLKEMEHVELNDVLLKSKRAENPEIDWACTIIENLLNEI